MSPLRLRSPNALRHVPLGSLLVLFILATVEVSDVQPVAEKLREAATLAGCDKPVVAMRSTAEGAIEILVTCKGD